MSVKSQNKVLDFLHYKETGKILHKSVDVPNSDQINKHNLDIAVESFQIICELSTDEILLEIKNRIKQKDCNTLYASIPFELLLDELGYRAIVIDHILVTAIEKYTLE